MIDLKNISNYIYSNRIRWVFIIYITCSLNIFAQNTSGDTVTNTVEVSSSKYMLLVDSSFIAGNAQKYELALDYLHKAINLEPNNPLNPLLLNNVAGIYQLLGQYDKALISYSAALTKDPDQETIRYNRALLEGKLNKNKAALTDYSLLVAKNPENQLYRYQRAMIYILEKEFSLAEVDLKYIIEKDDTSLKAREGYALLETMRGNYNNAERLYDYIIDKLPKYSKGYEGRARMFLANKMIGFALRDANKALELSKNNPSSELFRLRYEIFMAMGDVENAMIEKKKAEAIEKNHPDIILENK